MTRSFRSTVSLLALTLLTAGSATAQSGGMAMSHSPDIVDLAVGTRDLSTLVAAVKAASLVETLQGKGPFTVFAPTNEAFAALPAGTVASLLKPENKATLTTILTYHVLAGKFDAKTVLAAIASGKGRAEVKTVQGETLTLSTKGGKVMITDAKGNVATVATADVMASNGVVHVIDKVLMP